MGGRSAGRYVMLLCAHMILCALAEGDAAYVRTQIVNPLLALTVSITLRPESPSGSQYRHSSHHSLGAQSIISDADSDVEGASMNDEDADMDALDILGGLAGGTSNVLIVKVERPADSCHSFRSTFSSPLRPR